MGSLFVCTFLPLKSFIADNRRYEWQVVADDLRQKGLPVTKAGLVVLVVFLQRLCRAGVLRPSAIDEDTVIRLARRAVFGPNNFIDSDNPAAFIDLLAANFYTEADAAAGQVASDISALFRADFRRNKISFRWATGAIACSVDEHARQYAREIDVAFMRAEMPNEDLDVLEGLVRRGVPDVGMFALDADKLEEVRSMMPAPAAVATRPQINTTPAPEPALAASPGEEAPGKPDIPLPFIPSMPS